MLQLAASFQTSPPSALIPCSRRGASCSSLLSFGRLGTAWDFGGVVSSTFILLFLVGKSPGILFKSRLGTDGNTGQSVGSGSPGQEQV